MPNGKDKKKKQEVSTKPDGRARALTAKGKVQGAGERNRRMAGYRQDQLDKDIKDAGGASAYLSKRKKLRKKSKPAKKAGESLSAYRRRVGR
jgi:hypothetical protein